MHISRLPNAVNQIFDRLTINLGTPCLRAALIHIIKGVQLPPRIFCFHILFRLTLRQLSATAAPEAGARFRGVDCQVEALRLGSSTVCRLPSAVVLGTRNDIADAAGKCARSGN